MSEETIVLHVREPPKEKPTCDLCGKPCSLKDIWVGGYLTYAHHECAEIGHKAVELYLRWLLSEMWGLELFAEAVLKVAKKMKGVEVEGECKK